MGLFDTLSVRFAGKTLDVQTHEFGETMNTYRPLSVCPCVESGFFVFIENVEQPSPQESLPETWASFLFRDKMLVDWNFSESKEQAELQGKRMLQFHLYSANAERNVSLLANWETRKNHFRETFFHKAKFAAKEWTWWSQGKKPLLPGLSSQDFDFDRENLADVIQRYSSETERLLEECIPRLPSDFSISDDFLGDGTDVLSDRSKLPIKIPTSFSFKTKNEWKQQLSEVIIDNDYETARQLVSPWMDNAEIRELLNNQVEYNLVSWGSSFCAAEWTYLGGLPPRSIEDYPFMETPLFHKVLFHLGCEEFVAKTILKTRLEFINDKDSKGNSPLHLAVQSGVKWIVQFLLDNNAELNAKNHRGDTPLHFAVLNNDCEMIRLLFDKGAETNILNEEGKNLLHIAVEMSSYRNPNSIKEMLNLLSSFGYPFDDKIKTLIKPGTEFIIPWLESKALHDKHPSAKGTQRKAL